jgi:hypothetical protein
MNKCSYCFKEMNKPWIEYNNNINLCSYICSNRYSENNHYDKSWNNIKNKKDFEKYLNLVPILPKRNNINDFQYLSLEEINKMSDDEKIKYFESKNNQFYIDELSYSINEEIYNEDKRTYELELDYEYNNSSNDDY